MAPGGLPRTRPGERRGSADPAIVRRGWPAISRDGAAAARTARDRRRERTPCHRIRVLRRQRLDAGVAEESRMSAASGLARTPAPPYYAVIFTSKRTMADDRGYGTVAERMVDLGSRYEGFLGIESVRGADG